MLQPVEVKVEVKRKYAYITVTDYGPQYDEDEDSSNLAFVRLGWDCDCYVTVHRIIKEELSLVEATLKNILDTKWTSIKWTELEESLSDYLSDSYRPYDLLNKLFEESGVSAKKIKSYDENLKA